MIDALLFSALADSKISHEEFSNIITEANIYENIKENIKKLTAEPSSLERTVGPNELPSMAELTRKTSTKEKLTTL